MATFPTIPPQRPMDPSILRKTLTRNKIDVRFKTKFMNVLRLYNKNLLKSYKKYEKEYEKLTKKLETDIINL